MQLIVGLAFERGNECVAQPYFVVENPVMSRTGTKDKATHDFGVPASSTSIITTFAGIEYYLDVAPAQAITLRPPRPFARLFSGLNGYLLPCTVINSSKDQLNEEDLDTISTKFALHDDVWTRAFLEGERLSVAVGLRSQCSTVVDKLTLVNSCHTPNVPLLEDTCCATWGLYPLRSRVYSYAERSLCNSASNWRNLSRFAVLGRSLQRVHWRISHIQSSTPMLPVAHHRGEPIIFDDGGLADIS